MTEDTRAIIEKEVKLAALVPPMLPTEHLVHEALIGRG